IVADSLALSKKSSPLQSSKSRLFWRNTRGMGGRASRMDHGNSLCGLCASVANRISDQDAAGCVVGGGGAQVGDGGGAVLAAHGAARLEGAAGGQRGEL